MYNNPYMTNYNPNISQIGLNERIDNEISKLQQMKEQMKNNNNQQPAINQTFQLAPTNNHITACVNGYVIDTWDCTNKKIEYIWKIS